MSGRGAAEADHLREQSVARDAREGAHRLCDPNQHPVGSRKHQRGAGGSRITQFCHCARGNLPNGWQRFVRCRGNRVSGGAGPLTTWMLFRTFLALMLVLTLGVQRAPAQCSPPLYPVLPAAP